MSLSLAACTDFGRASRGTYAIIPESEISLEKQGTSWRWRQSSANSSQHACSLFSGKIQGNLSTSGLKTTILAAFVRAIQSLSIGIP